MSQWWFIAVASYAGLVGYLIGATRGLERGRREGTVRLQSGQVTVTLDVTAVGRLLDQHGMVAMPKGPDFQPKEEDTW